MNELENEVRELEEYAHIFRDNNYSELDDPFIYGEQITYD